MKALFLALLCTVCTATAENWPRFRGPTGQGHSSEKKLPLEWSTNKNVAWKTAVPGEGWSSPIVWHDQLFVTSTTDGGSRCHVICVDVRSGKIAWDKEIIEQVPRRKEPKNSYATPTPVTDGNMVYATFGDGTIVALTMEGSVAWTNREVKFYSRHGLGSSPIIYQDVVIQCFDGSNPVEAAGTWPKIGEEEGLGWRTPWDKAVILALDKTTGKRVWTGRRGLSRIAHITPIVARVDGRDQLISGAGDRMQGFDPKSGELIWSVYQQGEGVTPSPVVGDGLLFTSSGFEKSTLRAIKLGGGKGDVTTSHIVWEQKRGVPTQASPVFIAPYVYCVTDAGMATCYKMADGEIVWQERLGGSFSASPVFADGKVYFLNEAAETTVLKPGGEFVVLAKNKLDGRTQASIAAADGKLFIRTDKNLYCIAPQD